MTETIQRGSARLLCVWVVVLLALVGGCGASGRPVDLHQTGRAAAAPIEWAFPPRPIGGLRQRVVGRGAGAAVLLWDATRRRPPREVVVFLHGYELLPPWTYGYWLRHLAAAGNAIVYPVYQDPATPPGRFRAGALRGIAAGLRAVRASPSSVVAVGVSTGGALAFDYAAVASAADVPAPRAVAAVYPARNPPGGEVPPARLGDISSRTRLLVIGGPGDPIPEAEAQARGLLTAADQVPPHLRSLRRPTAAGRYSPQEDDRRARLFFWRPVDGLIAAARAAGH
ncbi:MAG: hypothetical protein JST53_14060 [Actinobacteria bacterium]|nr:hypothetical protein [Actinomycetota bacterium]